jgi:putative transposase
VANYVFESFLKEQGIKQILCGVNHPQTNGKVEKLFDFYEHHRGRYSSLTELVDWYNDTMHGSLNMHYAETPNEAFTRKMSFECWMWMANKLLNGDFL